MAAIRPLAGSLVAEAVTDKQRGTKLGAFTEALASNYLKSGPPCRVRVALDTFDKDDAAALTAALADPEVPRAAITRSIRAAGISIGQEAVGRHTNGICACGQLR